MKVSVDAVRQDAARLHRFIEPLIRMCSDLREDYPVFADSSISFFSYISQLGLATQAYLESFPAYYEKSADERSANSKRQSLFTLKVSWETLHNYVRPALDADSLHLPMSLVTAFTDIVNSVQDWHSYQFVLFHTSEANYLQIPSAMARKAADEIADKVQLRGFDPTLGLVGIPYSQSESFYLNSLLPHEFAHFIYQEYSSGDIEDEIESTLNQIIGDPSHLTPEDLAWCLRELRSWVEETFCDLLAICMVGPSFSLALIQLTGATALVGMPDGEPSDSYAFRDAYPADAARLHFHHQVLVQLGWWDVIQDWKSTSIRTIDKCTVWSELINIEGYVPEGVTRAGVTDDHLLECYQSVCRWMVSYCSGFFPNVSDLVTEYRSLSPVVSDYLSRAIVPSTIIIDGEQVYPSPVILLNSGFHFLLEKLPELIRNIHGENSLSVETQSRIGSRLELWILKAIEDNRLLTRQVT